MLREFLKASALTGSSTLAALILRLITNKIFAVMLGPAGIGGFALLRHVHDLSTAFATLQSGTMLIQQLASKPPSARPRIVAGAALLFGCGGLAAVALLVLGSLLAAPLLLEGEERKLLGALPLLAFTVAAAVLLNLANAVVNAEKRYAVMALLGIAGPLAWLALTYPVAIFAKDGRFEAWVGGQFALALLGFSICLYALRDLSWLGKLPRLLFAAGTWREAQRLLGLARWVFFYGIADTAGHLAVRALILAEAGIVGLGYFQAAGIIAGTLFGLLLSSFRVYQLPALSASADGEARRELMRQFLNVLLLLIAPGVAFLLVLRGELLHLLYAADFVAAAPVLTWLLLDSFLEVVSYVLGTALFAAGEIRLFAFLIVARRIIAVALAAILLESGYGVEGAALAVFAANLVLIAILLVACRRRLGFRPAAENWTRFTVGIGLIATCLLIDYLVEDILIAAPLAAGPCIAFFVLLSNREERSTMQSLARGLGARIANLMRGGAMHR